MDRRKNAANARWGAACSPCALAKAKCLRSGEELGTRCDRCERLQKDCVNQIQKPRKKRQSKPSKTAQLERRLDSLVDFIKANNSGNVPASLRQASDVRQTVEGSVSVQSQEQALDDSQSQTPSSNYEPLNTIPKTYNQHAPRVCVCRAQAGEDSVPLEPDETLSSTFVTKLMPNYPFVAFPPGVTASELTSRHPFLFTTIRMIASYRNLKSMRSQTYFIMKHISEQMLMCSERSLELLQSILLVLGCYHYHCMLHAQLNNLIGLANSLVADLGLNKAPDLQERTKLLYSHEPLRARTNDERRALCGVWYMTSIIALAFQRIDSPKYTPYIDQCLKELEEDQEYATDSLLVHLIRIQHLSERISQLNSKDQGNSELTGIARAPMSAYSGMFHTELENFKALLPPDLATNKLVMCHINTAALRLWEPPRIDVVLLERISNSLASLSLDSASSLDIFYRCSGALKSWFTCWLSIDVTDYFVLPMPVSAQLINAVIMLARWSKLSSPISNRLSNSGTTSATQIVRSDPGCGAAAMASAPALGAKDIDPAIPVAVRAIRNHLLSQPELQIDVPAILQAMATRFEQAREASSKQSGDDVAWENDIWDMAARKIKGTRAKLERWAELVAISGAENREPEPTGVNDTREPEMAGGQGMEGNWPMNSQGMDVCVQLNQGEWNSDSPWMNDFFEEMGLDQNFFFDGPGDYGTVVLDSLGPS
ncbi:hypothetical protein F4819DRAFT_136640 [Hypoxylon fuscum]|nr:hypothetical protein F4819DRAFT_136640 [Hypoxylon fuscum]